jgi:hypothetical protein
MGRILFGGTAALLICLFLAPKFIEFLREREFGQHIREDGPEGHHEKAGTPTMGGVIIFIAISVPFLILTDYDWRSVGVFGAMIASALRRLPDRPRPVLPAADLLRRRRDDQRGQPDRRPRRPGGGLRGDRAAGVHRHHVHHRRG